MRNRLLERGRIEQVLEHAAVDLAVLRFGRAARPGREEDVRRRGAAYGRGDRLGVLEVCRQMRDPRIEPLGVAAQAGDLPAIGEEALREVSSADAGHADDKCAPAHVQ